MRIHRHRRFQRQAQLEKTLFRVNERIRVPDVLVIDENGESLGAMQTPNALALAKERGLDLIEVGPKATPPVCRFLNYKQFRYEQEKAQKARKAHAKKVEVKGVRLSLRIGEHDRQLRLKQARQFLDQGNRVSVDLILRGRERRYREQAQDVIEKFVVDLRKEYELANEPFSFQGGRSSMVVGGKRRTESGEQKNGTPERQTEKSVPSSRSPASSDVRGPPHTTVSPPQR